MTFKLIEGQTSGTPPESTTGDLEKTVQHSSWSRRDTLFTCTRITRVNSICQKTAKLWNDLHYTPGSNALVFTVSSNYEYPPSWSRF